MIRTWMRYLGCIFLDRENARSAMNSAGGHGIAEKRLFDHNLSRGHAKPQ